MFCQKCGKEMADNAAFCPSCGAPATAVPVWSSGVPQTPVEPVSGAWYLVPFFFGIIGGIIAWAVNKDRDPSRARNLLIFGLVWSVVWFAVGILIAVVFFFATVPTPTPYP